MEHASDILLLSLKQDLKTLSEIVQNIDNQCGGSNISSWLYPTKPHSFVNELIRDTIAGLEDFRSYLELIVDRLYVGIQLILKYIDSVGENQVYKNRLIYKPKQVTLGFSFQTLWTTIAVTLEETMRKNSNEQSRNGDNITTNIISKESQTDTITLDKCDSCSAATLCMKNLLHTFEHGEGGKISGRQLIRPKIYDITQFGCMMQTTTAVENCLNKLFEKVSTKDQENNILRRENETLKSEIASKFGKIALLERNVELFKEKCEKDTFKIASLANENENLLQINNKHEFRIKTLEEIIENLYKAVRSYKEKTQKLVQEKNTMNMSFNEVLQTQINLVKLNLSMQKKFNAIESKHNSMENYLYEASNTVDVINNKLDNFTKLYGEMNEKIENFHKGLETSYSYISNKSQEFLQSLKNHTNTSISHSNVKNGNFPGFKVKGDPVEDLARQIQENTEKIELLQQENVKLQKIIAKLKRIEHE